MISSNITGGLTFQNTFLGSFTMTKNFFFPTIGSTPIIIGFSKEYLGLKSGMNYLTIKGKISDPINCPATEMLDAKYFLFFGWL
jgi:hypothetical protein